MILINYHKNNFFVDNNFEILKIQSSKLRQGILTKMLRIKI